MGEAGAVQRFDGRPMRYTGDVASSQDSYFVQGLARGLEVMRTFDAEHQRLRLAEVASRSGVSRAAARRALLTMRDLGYIRVDGSYFELTPRVLELGYAYLSGHSLARLGRPFLEELADRLNESTSLSVLSGTDILYVERVHRHHIIRPDITVGTKFPALVTAMGRVLIAGMPPEGIDEVFRHVELIKLTPFTIVDESELRRQLAVVAESGWALVDQEFEIGLRSIAAPVRRPVSREVVAAINVSIRVTEEGPMDREELERVVTELSTTADGIGRAIEIAATP